ncbi:MAG: AAA family ATPase [Deltaproteobacteria bacterium]|nr:AAA family ATPase [Deltaproteobacteria bacterium]
MAMTKALDDLLASYVEALFPIIYIHHFDYVVADDIIDKAVKKVSASAKIFEFNNARGEVDFFTKAPRLACTLQEFLSLNADAGFDHQTFIVLKGVHNQLTLDEVVAHLKIISDNNLYRDGYYATVIIVSEKLIIPFELENYITLFDIPLPDSAQIGEIIRIFLRENMLSIPDELLSEFVLSFKGLNDFQIRQILNLAYQDGGDISNADRGLVLNEKEQFIKKTEMLEIVNFKETIDDIGGLERLKAWLGKKSVIFSFMDKALKFGVDSPKGIMIIGMPGCGKSLTAKATSKLFGVQLVRLDVGRLLGKYVGESEENMRKALTLAEAISPCVLWIDEIEKAFAGIGPGSGGHEVTTRLFGHFLTWMQEKSNTVFVVATANDITNLPPEFLRKGRFDELFYVDLPNDEERLKIIEIHVKKRGKWSSDLNAYSLAMATGGFSGADLEAVVKETIENAFINGDDGITTEMLENVIKETKSISVTLEKKILEIREKIKEYDITPASKKNEDEPSVQANVK